MQKKTWETLKFNHLQPLKKRGKKKLGKFIVFDIESNNWKDFVLGGIYDGSEFKHYRTVEGLRKGLESYEDTTVFAHFGGIFDFLFMLEDYGINRMLDSSTDLVMRGSSIFMFKVGKLRFIDSSGILPFGLDKAAKAFQCDYQKINIDHDKHKTVTPRLIKYLEHDCKALYECVEKYSQAPILDGANFKPTLASQSLEILRKYIGRSIPSLNSKAHDDFVRLSYAGGRTEIFRPLFDSDTHLFYYDFNSLYPSVMRDLAVPGRVSRVHNRINELTISDVEVEVPEDEYLPVLWKKQQHKFIFPTGRFRGVFCGPELIEAQKQGVKILKVYQSLEFENLGPLFKDYIDDLYKMKLNAKDPVQTMIAKLLLNAGYGRMGIKRERESLCIDDGSTGITPIDVYIGNMRLAKKDSFFGGFSNSAIASFITCHARLKLFRALKPIQNYIYYCDTDSIVTTALLPTGKGLGELKLEGSAHQACFLLPKTYTFGDQTKMKGFPKEFAQSKNFTDLAQALEGDLRGMKVELPGSLARIKSARGTDSILKVLPKGFKQLRHRYDKRHIFEENGGFNTKPLVLNEI